MREESPVRFERIKRRFRALFRRDELERELETELRFHLDRDEAENLRRGMNLKDAHFAALKSFGGLEQSKEECRDARGMRSITQFFQDLRYAGRKLRQNRAFTAVIVLTLAIGIGANCVVFSVVNAVLLRPLPYPNSERLVLIGQSFGRDIQSGLVSAPNYLDFRNQTTVFENTALFSDTSRNMTGVGEPERLAGQRVSASYFPTLRISPLRGRTFAPEEDQPGKNRVVLLSYGFWLRRLGADEGVVGKTLTLDGVNHVIVGVMPASIYGDTEIWIPMALSTRELSLRQWNHLSMLARLRPGISILQAQTELNAIADRIRQENPDVGGGGTWGVAVKSLYEGWVHDIRRPLIVLLIAVGFVLLIACSNIANLLLARSATRRQEIALRSALGASRWRIVRQLLTESVLLALIGGGVGLLLSLVGIKVLVALNQRSIPRWQEIGVDSWALAFAVGISLLTSLLFGLAPALHASNLKLNASLVSGARSSLSGFRRLSLRNLLIVSEVALALILLMGAGLLVKSFSRLLEVKLGFDPQNLLTMQVSLPTSKYETAEQRRAFYEQALKQIKAAPGVVATGAVSNLPLSGLLTNGGFAIEGRSDQFPADLRSVSNEYLQVMRIPLLSGRYFTDQDRTGMPEVVIVDEILAHRYFPNDKPVGKRVSLNGPGEAPHWREVVGVVGPIKYQGLDVDYQGQLYFPHSQDPWDGMYRMHIVVRTAGDPKSLASAVQTSIYHLDKDQPVYRVMTMQQLVADSLATRRFSMALLGLFAVVASLLAAVGLYGVLSYSITERRHEIGVRMALGAQTSDVLKLVAVQGMRLAMMGVALGLLGSLALTRMMKSLLFGVGATDPMTFALVPLLLGVVGFVACYIPARRATKVDPLISIRCE
jgi:putative ABC transport system permease protein